MITASLQNYRISPRKVRLVADMIRGKTVAEAKIILTHASKKARHPIHDLIDSAVANASHNFKIDNTALFVKEIRVDQGYVLKRSIPMARGSAFPMKKRTSHVKVVLAPVVEKASKKKAVAAPKTK
ncbi:MAG: ribosomal protein large subunit ribosomal protein [Candidatus Parcubacteria bacterium]|nr:ribosomal protein large subunit ribosomal protein [Candidatus Parcubacteria bacterium]